MGIHGLGKFLSEFAPGAVRRIELPSLMGRVLAIDASLSLYQFMIAIRDSEGFGNLTNEEGEATSHITGFLSRVVRFLEHGIKPVYVFDGKATSLKSEELKRRRERRLKAEEDLEVAIEAGDKEEIKKIHGRIVKITPQHNADVRELLRLIGCPIVDAPNEAEAQCARMAADGLAFGTATEDADALAFGSPILIRHLGVSGQQAKTKHILQFDLSRILSELKFTMPQFIDFCIMCGCDYCDRLKGIGPATAYKLIKQHQSIEKILESEKTKITAPENYCYKESREFFLSPEVLPAADIPAFTWTTPDEDGLREFLVKKHSFNPTRVDNYITRLRSAKKASSQQRLENFFGAVKVSVAASLPPPKTVAAGKGARGKRKSVDNTAPTVNKRKKL